MFVVAMRIARIRARRAVRAGASDIVIGWNCRDLKAIRTTKVATPVKALNVSCVVSPKVDAAFAAKARLWDRGSARSPGAEGLQPQSQPRPFEACMARDQHRFIDEDAIRVDGLDSQHIRRLPAGQRPGSSRWTHRNAGMTQSIGRPDRTTSREFRGC